MVTVRPLTERDLPEAQRIIRDAFGTFLGVPDLETFRFPPYAQTRFGAENVVSFAAERDGELLGSNFATHWGSVGFFGPLSTRPDLFPPHLIHELETLQDNVGPFPYEHVQRTFLEAFGKPPEEMFAEISPVPIASASVAQVHKARLPDGRIVAVKVRRPKIEQIVEFDLKVMRLFAWAS